jgi:hypothetical protein
MSKALRRPNGTFAPGWRGGGRPAGSRNRLSEIALGMLAENFEEHGEETIEEVRKSLPHIYLKIIAGLLPRSLHVERTSHFADLSDAELEELERHLAASRAKTVRAIEELNGATVTQQIPSSEDEPEKSA